jgi:GT2 family glycosyltransferase
LDLSVIIINYNVKYFLEQCLHAVTKACSGIEAEIFVVDNASTDGSKEYLESKFPKVIFKWNGSNVGFAKANNSVLAESKGGHILFLNPDTIIPEDCFEKSLAFFKTHKDCGALGVHMLDGTGRFLKESKRSFPSVATSFFKMTGFANLFPSSKLFAKYYAGHIKENENAEVDVLAGAFMMLSREVLEKLKGFDEDYFMYGEDIDLSYRIQKAGYKNYYFAGTTILHFKGESTQKRSRSYIRNFYGAMDLFVSKHYEKQKLKLYLVKASVAFSRIVASGALYVRSIAGNKINSSRPIQLAVICSQENFGKIIHLIKFSKTPMVINGRIAVDANDTASALGTITETEMIIKKNSLEQLVFCEGELSNKTIVEKVAELSSKATFLFHAAGSESIVGSNKKNENGFFIAKA